MELVFKILRLLGYLLLPMFFRPPGNVGLFGVLHALIVIAITVGLHFLQQLPAVQDRIKLTTESQLVRENWLSILFLLCYLLLWFGAWLWSLFKVDEEPSRYPDLDACWGEAVSALQKSGIGIGDTPIFLILGRFAGDEASLFHAGPPLAVAGVPGAGAPLRVYAHREAIFVTCTGASISGRQADLLEGQGTYAPSVNSSTGGNLGDIEKSIGMSMASGGALRDVQGIIRRAREENRSLTADEHRMIRELTGVNPATAGPGESRRSHASILKSPAEADECAARLRYLCRLIGRSRWPLCTLNGVVTLVSLNATDTDDDAQQMGLVVQRDLQAVREAARLHCPVFTLIGDLERLPGAQEFLAQFPADKRRQRLGKSFPLVPEVEPEKVGNTIEATVLWITESLIPFWVFKLFRLEAPGGTPADAIESNAQLFHFLTDLLERSARLAKLVSKGVVVSLDAPPLFGGCYLAGTDTGGERAFCPGFWKRLEETQGSVAWTGEAFAADARYRSLTQMGYVALGVAGIIVAALAVWLVFIKGD